MWNEQPVCVCMCVFMCVCVCACVRVCVYLTACVRVDCIVYAVCGIKLRVGILISTNLCCSFDTITETDIVLNLLSFVVDLSNFRCTYITL